MADLCRGSNSLNLDTGLDNWCTIFYSCLDLSAVGIKKGVEIVKRKDEEVPWMEGGGEGLRGGYLETRMF